MLCGVALVLTFCEYWLLNYCAFPLFDGVFIWTRELSAVAGGLALAALALGSFWSVRPPDGRLFTWGTFVSMTLGAAAVVGGIAWDSVALVALGAALTTIGGGLANVYVGLGCVGMSLRAVALAVGGAYVASYALRGVFALLPVAVNLALFVALPLVAVACVRRWAGVFVGGLGADESPAQMSVTAPRSFLPFGHQVFVVLVIFRVVYGYTLTFGEVGRVPAIVPWALALLGALLVAMAVHAVLTAPAGAVGTGATGGDTTGGAGAVGAVGAGVRAGACAGWAARPFPPDALFRVSVFFSIAGFLLVLLTGEARDALASTALATGTGCFEVLMYYVLIAVGTRNPSGALPALAWGNAMASWGTIVGATLGRATNQADPALLGGIVITIALALVAYAVFVLPSFSFARAIEGVEGVEPVASRVATVGSTVAGEGVGGLARRAGPRGGSGHSGVDGVALVRGTSAGGSAGDTCLTGDVVTGIAGGEGIAADAGLPLPEGRSGSSVTDPLEARCRQLAERGGLTERECEVLALLAHGRNARFIQESLAISYSTTKTHVSHIYQKLGVHAHQELLDLVESGDAGPAGVR